MRPRLLLDTHIVLRWMIEASRLSRVQYKALESAVQRAEPVALSAMTLLEIALLVSDKRLELPTNIDDFFNELKALTLFQVLPLTYEVASEIAPLRALKDPADRAIVATARVHRLQLVTSDQRIIESGLVAVIE